MFATCAVVRLPAHGDVARQCFEYALAGHPAPAVFSLDAGSVGRLGDGSAVLGVLPSPDFFGHKHQVRSGDLLFIFTDGLVEIANSKGEEFGWDRLQAVVERNKKDSLKSISEAILEEGSQWGVAMDDRTLLLIRFR